MRALAALGLTIGVLVGAWVYVSGSVGLPPWVAVIIWAGFFAAGGKVGGVLKMGAASLSGVLWAWLAVTAAGLFGGWAGALPVMVAIAAFVMCVQAGWSPLSFVPGTFMGAACLFGTSVDVTSTVICIVIGLVLGFISEWSAGLISGVGRKEDAAAARA
ncbi:DUF1097 domain-containing protein [Pseudonocardia sp.]|uniref:DUF1097 domain-containing protein n=1 Tax=Pseudonocardia sp. TaxID=60912 RepID=UPI003D0E20D4